MSHVYLPLPRPNSTVLHFPPPEQRDRIHLELEEPELCDLVVLITAEALTLSSDRHQLDSFAADEVQGFVHVGDLVETHLAFVGFGQPLT